MSLPITFDKNFPAAWRSGGATGGTEDQTAAVQSSAYSRDDIYVAVGCQRGYLHFKTAMRVALHMLEAAFICVRNAPSFDCIVTDPRGEDHVWAGVTTIEGEGGRWWLGASDGTMLTGPHDIAEGWRFRFAPNVETERARELYAALAAKLQEKGGETSAATAG